jgi:glycosyltransferase involved in cell wall biosynthesis
MVGTWRRLRNSRPEILHVHHVWPAADRYLTTLAATAGIPRLVITEHIVGSSHSTSQRALKRRELERADAVTAVCGAVADSVVADYHVPRARLRVIHNGTELPDDETLDTEAREARAVRAHFGVSGARPLWVCAARLESQKGHDVLLDAAAEMRKRSFAFVLAIAGDGSLRGPLEQRAARLGLTDSVHFLGRVDEVGSLYAAADAVVLPSRWEGLPLSLLEALARGRPVIATHVGGIPEVIENGVSGLLVPPDDAKALADALQSFHQRRDLALQLGAAGAERVAIHFTWDRMVEEFEATYDDVLGLGSFEPEPGRRETRRTAGKAHA